MLFCNHNGDIEKVSYSPSFFFLSNQNDGDNIIFIPVKLLYAHLLTTTMFIDDLYGK